MHFVLFDMSPCLSLAFCSQLLAIQMDIDHPKKKRAIESSSLSSSLNFLLSLVPVDLLAHSFGFLRLPD